MADVEVFEVAGRVHGHLRQLLDEEGIYLEDIASDLGGEEELQVALLATAIVEKLIEPTSALLPMLQERRNQYFDRPLPCRTGN